MTSNVRGGGGLPNTHCAFNTSNYQQTLQDDKDFAIKLHEVQLATIWIHRFKKRH